MPNWYIDHDGNPLGPMQDEQVLELIRRGGMHDARICEVGGDKWHTIMSYPVFARALRAYPRQASTPPPSVRRAESGPLPQAQHIASSVKGPASAFGDWPRLAIGVVAVIGLGVVAYFSLDGEPDRAIASAPEEPLNNTATLPGTGTAATPDPPSEPTILERLNATSGLEGGLEILSPNFNNTRDEQDEGAMVLAIWLNSVSFQIWEQIHGLPESKRALVMKDPELERGKKLCVTGSIVEIHTDRTTGSPIYEGGIIASNGDVVRFLAIGSSGEIVERSGARICGVVIGLYSYSNSAGGVTHAVNIVGVFDLPDNKPVPVRAAAQ